MGKFLLPALAAVAGCLLLSTPAAATINWTGAGTGNLWQTEENWQNDTVPGPGNTAIFGQSSPNAAQTIDLDGQQITTRLSLNNTGNRTYLVQGGTLELRHVPGLDPLIGWSNFANRQVVTFDADLLLSRDDETENAVLRFTGGNADTAFVMNGDILGSTGTGFGTRTMNYGSSTSLVMNGANLLTAVVWSAGEIVAANQAALGQGSVQVAGGSQTTLSLRTDVSLGTNASGQSWVSNQNTHLRISEETPGGDVDRVLTAPGRLIQTGSGGKLTFVDNVNSSANLILRLTESGGGAHNVNIELNDTAIVRFDQDGAKTYAGELTGGGRVEFTGGGTTTFNSAHGSTGSFVIENDSTLALTLDGSISDAANIHFDSGSTLSLAGITASSYTFSSGQLLSGSGSVVSGGKDLALNGSVSPGNSPGTLTFDLGGAALSLGADLELFFDLGSSSDQIVLQNGDLDIGVGTLDFSSFSFIAGPGFDEGIYTLFSGADSLTGTLGTNLSGQINGFTGILGLDGNDVILTVIPEPGTLVFLVLAVSGWVIFRSRSVRRA